MHHVADGLFYTFVLGCGILAIYFLACVSLWLFDRFKDQQ
jgi:hypothetical protein